MTAFHRSNRYRVFFSKEVAIIPGAVFLTASGGGQHLDRRAAARGEYRRERPPAQRPSHESVLPLVEGRLVHKERVVNELAVKGLYAVHRIGVEGIVRSEFTG